MIQNSKLPQNIVVDNMNSAFSLLQSKDLSIAVIDCPDLKQQELCRQVADSKVSDIVILANRDNLQIRIYRALLKAGLILDEYADKILDSIVPEINDFLSLGQTEEAEIQFQIRVNNLQAWHTDAGETLLTPPWSQLNYAKTLVGEYGTLFVMDSDIDREVFLNLAADLSKEEDKSLYGLWRELINQLCESSIQHCVPTGSGFVYKTSEEYGLIHRPPTIDSKRLFLKVRPYSELTSIYLKSRSASESKLKEQGFVIVNTD